MAERTEQIMAKKEETPKIIIDKEKEMKTEGITDMIDEGGIGAEKYYKVEKAATTEEAERKREELDEKK